MGYFSWHAQDTDRSIANSSSNRSTFTVYMVDDKGNEWIEKKYGGYGRFDGKDFYVLLAEMNGIATGNHEADRDAGINLAFTNSPSGENPKCKFPNLFESPKSKWRNTAPRPCDDQGFFYPRESKRKK
jgi:hypothetical protein